MATDSFNSFQIADALARQGMPGDKAQALAYQIGDKRLTRAETTQLYTALGMENATLPEAEDGKRDNTILEDTLFAGAAAGGAAGLARMAAAKPDTWMNKVGNSGVGKLAIPGAAGMAALMLNPFDESNFYERATTPELLANIAGVMGGGVLGDAVGQRVGGGVGDDVKSALGKLDPAKGAYAKIRNDNVLKAASEAAVKAKESGNIGTMAKTLLQQAPKVGAAKLAGTAVGRGLGGAIGAIGGPIGSVALGTLGGYLLPKLFPGNSPTVEEDDGTERSSLANAGLTAAGVTALGLAASPYLRAKAVKEVTGLGSKVANSSIAQGASSLAKDAASLAKRNTPQGVKNFANEKIIPYTAPFADEVGRTVSKAVSPATGRLKEASAAGDAAYETMKKDILLGAGDQNTALEAYLKKLGAEGSAAAEGATAGITALLRPGSAARVPPPVTVAPSSTPPIDMTGKPMKPTMSGKKRKKGSQTDAEN